MSEHRFSIFAIPKMVSHENWKNCLANKKWEKMGETDKYGEIVYGYNGGELDHRIYLC